MDLLHCVAYECSDIIQNSTEKHWQDVHYK